MNLFKYCTIGAATLGLLLQAGAATPAEIAAAGNTVKPLLGTLPGKSLNEEDATLDKAVATGEPGFAFLCSQLAEANGSKDGQVRWLMHGVTHRILGTKNQSARKGMEKALLDALASGKHGVEASTFILRQLRWIGTVDAVAPIGAAAKTNAKLTTAATQCLMAMANTLPHDPIKAQLRAALPGKTGEAKINVIKALGSLRDANAVSDFMAAAKAPEEDLRHAGLRALANLGDKRGGDILKAATKTKDVYDQDRALSWYLQYAVRLAENGDKNAGAAICRDVFNTQTGPEDGQIQCRALSDLATILGAGALPELTKALENQSAYVRNVASVLLTKIPGEAVTKEIAAKLSSPDAGTRLAAVGFLAKRKDAAAGVAIAKALTDKDPGVRQAAVDAAVSLQLTTAVPTLLNILGTGSDAEKEAAQSALSALRGKAISAQIGKELATRPDAEKVAIIEVLVARGARDQAPAVLQAAASTDRKVAKAALKGLNGLATPKELPALIDNMLTTSSASARKSWQNAIVATAITQIESPAARIAPITARLNGSSGKQREALLQALGRIGGAPALAVVTKDLASTNNETATAAVRVLSKWTDAAPAPDLLKVAETAKDADLATLAMRGFLKLTEQAINAGDNTGRADQLKRAAKASKSADERKQIEALIKKATSATEPNLIWSAPLTGNLDARVGKDAAITAKGNAKASADGLALSGGDVRVKLTDALKKAVSSPMTVTAWVKPTGTSGKQRILSSLDRGGWGFGLNGNSLEITTYGVRDYTSQPNAVAANQWQHVAVSLDAKHTARMYVNGAIIATVENGGGPAAFPGGEIAIGAFPAAGEKFNGLIRDLRVYNTVLADARVKSVFGQQATKLGAKAGIPKAAAAKPAKPSAAPQAKKGGPPRGPSGEKEPASNEHFQYEGDPEEGFVSIFNGKDLTGWIGDVKGYYVENNELRCGKKGGKVYLKDEYSDFVLRFDFKLTPGANNGLGIRTPLNADPAYAGMELQILDDTAPQYAKLKKSQYHGSIYKCADAKLGHQKPVGEWNTQEVICIGKHVKVTLNGTVITDAYLDLLPTYAKHKGMKRDKGYIGFLGHGAEVAFRNLRLRDYSLPAPTPGTSQNTPPKGFKALFNGKDLTNWQGLVANPPKRQAMNKDQLAKAFEKANANMRAHWQVKDGALQFDGKGQSLCTKKLYGDFDLYVDWKIHPKGDSGLYLRGTPQMQIWDPTNESQWKHGADKGSGCLWNNKFAGQRPLVKADNPIGEWNTFLVRMVNDQVTCFLNGKQVLDNVVLENYWQRNLPIYRKEQIELQNHGNTLYFKNIYIRELPY